MTRRIVRTSLQLGFLLLTAITLLYFLDSRYSVLPSSIHSHLPLHHPGLVITDITVRVCSIRSCKLDPEKWHRIEKDLYLNSGWISKAYLHVQRKQEKDLLPEDSVVLDVKVGRLDPGTQQTADKAEKWEKREAGIWLKRSTKPHDSDSNKAVTAVDVLFGADAVEPRPGWELLNQNLLLDSHGEKYEARLSIRRGPPAKLAKHVPRVRTDGKFKIMQVSDLHLSTGLGVCREPEPEALNGVKCDADPRTLEFVGLQLDVEKPDLVVLSGDQVNGETAPDAQSAVFKFAELLVARQIPFACTFGNHDDAGSLSRAATADLLSMLPYSLTEHGPNTIPGVGNYYIEVLANSKQHSALTLYFLDTHAYSPDRAKYDGYDWIKPEQIEWFRNTATMLQADHSKYSHIHLDMAFIHIPLPEYVAPAGVSVGEAREGVTAPAYNSGFRDALADMGIGVVSCGHDHANDYCLLSEKQAPSAADKRASDADDTTRDSETEPAGLKHPHSHHGSSASTQHQPPPPPPPPPHRDNKLWLCYAGGSGLGGYGGYNGYIRRVRLFEYDANAGRITTWKKVEYVPNAAGAGAEKGKGQHDAGLQEARTKRVDEQIIVERGRVVAGVDV